MILRFAKKIICLRILIGTYNHSFESDDVIDHAILSSLKKNEQKYIKHISTNFYITYILIKL